MLDGSIAAHQLITRESSRTHKLDVRKENEADGNGGGKSSMNKSKQKAGKINKQGMIMRRKAEAKKSKTHTRTHQANVVIPCKKIPHIRDGKENRRMKRRAMSILSVARLVYHTDNSKCDQPFQWGPRKTLGWVQEPLRCQTYSPLLRNASRDIFLVRYSQ